MEKPDSSTRIVRNDEAQPLRELDQSGGDVHCSYSIFSHVFEEYAWILGFILDYGTYSSFQSQLAYLKYLGVTLIRIMSLEPMQCSLSSSICIKCWCAFCLLRSSLDQASIVYPGVQHPNFGSISELQLLVRAIHSYGMRVVLDMDLSGFDGHSNFYNYDESAAPSRYGPLFVNATEYAYDGRKARALNLEENEPARTVLEDTLYDLTTTLGFDGVYWKGLLCFRLNSAHCALGSGRDNSVNTELLQRVVATFEDVQIWVRAEAVREG